MNLTCYLFPGWEPRIRAASPKRGWMDDAPEAFPYRCLPLNIANSHGWEILSPCGFEVVWNGGSRVDDVIVRPDPGARPADVPVALFGLGTFTFHVQGLFRTAPGWNLWVSGPPNWTKDGAAALSAIVETDWSPYTFTMNWQLTRPDYPVRFAENEPFAHIFPIPRRAIEDIQPAFAPIDEDPQLKAQFQEWSRSRDAFHERMRTNPPDNPSEKWQKLYYRGQSPDGKCPVSDHQAKLRVREFARNDLTGSAQAQIAKPITRKASATSQHAAPATPQADAAPEWQAAKLAWVLRTQQRQRALAPGAHGIFRSTGVGSDEFLNDYYAASRPVVLANLVGKWPACRKWSPEYLVEKIGECLVEYQGDRTSNPDFEVHKDSHKRRSTFAEFMQLVTLGKDNDYYITAYNSAVNQEAFASLADDLGSLDEYLRHEPGRFDAMFWIGPKNTFTPLHHDLTNNLLVQFVGRKRVILVSPAETPRLYNDVHVFSRLRDLAALDPDGATYPLAHGVSFDEVMLEPGDALFIPIGWWHQIRSLDFSVSATYTNFKWPNEGWHDHPESRTA